MKIAIINLTGSGMSGGYYKYLKNVIPRLAKHPEVSEILCVSPKTLNVKAWFEQFPNVEFMDCNPFRFMHHSPDPKLKLLLKKFDPDIIFVPLERYFKYNGIPFVTMIQNMAPLASPVKVRILRERLRYLAQTIETKIAVKKATRVIAISNFVKEYLVKEWHTPSDKISTIYFGVKLNISNEKKPNFIPDNWENHFLFTAGSIDPFRGLEDIFLSMKLLVNKNIRLIIAGETRPIMASYQQELNDFSLKNNFSNLIQWAGHLNESEMVWCYKKCKLFIITSRVEACPNIALEAMAHGCICVAANNPPLPEILSDAAVYYPPMNGKALSEVVKSVLNWDNEKIKEMSEKAKKRAAQFSWDICAEKTLVELMKTIHDYRLENT